MPCFRDRILECGNERQRRMLNEVGKTLMFLCSPFRYQELSFLTATKFSVDRQRVLIKNQKCIGEILALPVSNYPTTLTYVCLSDDLGNA